MKSRGKSWWRRAVDVIKGMDKKIHTAIEGMVEGLPDTMELMSEGWRTHQTVDLNRQKEKLLRRFVAQDKVLFGNDSPYRIGSLLSLASWYQGQYRLSDAHMLYEEAWRLAAHSGECERIVRTAQTVAQFLQIFAKDKCAAQVYEEAWQLVSGAGCRWTLQVELLDAWAQFLEGASSWKQAVAVRSLGVSLIERGQGLTADALYRWIDRLIVAHRQLGDTQSADLRTQQSTCLLALQGGVGRDPDSVFRVRDLETLASVQMSLANPEAAQSLRAHARFIRIYHKALSDPLPNLREVEEACAFLAARGKSGDESVLLRLRQGAKTKHDRHQARLARR